MGHRNQIYELKNGITVRSYANGSYSWMSPTKGWRNIPSELAQALIEGNRK